MLPKCNQAAPQAALLPPGEADDLTVRERAPGRNGDQDLRFWGHCLRPTYRPALSWPRAGSVSASPLYEVGFGRLQPFGQGTGGMRSKWL
jgi:hypothetical protein